MYSKKIEKKNEFFIWFKVFFVFLLFLLLQGCKLNNMEGENLPTPTETPLDERHRAKKEDPGQFITLSPEEKEQLIQTALERLAALKDKDWEAQYALLHPEVQEIYSLTEYSQYMSPQESLQVVDYKVAGDKIKYLKEKEFTKLGKTYGPVARVLGEITYRENGKEYITNDGYWYFIKLTADKYLEENGNNWVVLWEPVR